MALGVAVVGFDRMNRIDRIGYANVQNIGRNTLHKICEISILILSVEMSGIHSSNL